MLFFYVFTAPEGVDRPTITIVSETALRVSWMAPETPNGKITGYNIYINGEKIETNLVTPGSYVITDLLPYTVYIIQVCILTLYANITDTFPFLCRKYG